MIRRLSWLGLEVSSLARTRRFYGHLLGLAVVRESDDALRYVVGDTELRLATVDAPTPGGRHVHYAFTTPPEEYERWLNQLSGTLDVEEHDFGVYRSMYFFDPDDHCVEIGTRGEQGTGLTGIFEIVLQVESLDRAEKFYTRLASGVIDRGQERRRVRLDMEAFELELWEPQVGLAGARPGEDVALGIVIGQLDTLIANLSPLARTVEPASTGYHVIDPDGHRLVLYGA